MSNPMLRDLPMEEIVRRFALLWGTSENLTHYIGRCECTTPVSRLPQSGSDACWQRFQWPSWVNVTIPELNVSWTDFPAGGDAFWCRACQARHAVWGLQTRIDYGLSVYLRLISRRWFNRIFEIEPRIPKSEKRAESSIAEEFFQGREVCPVCLGPGKSPKESTPAAWASINTWFGPPSAAGFVECSECHGRGWVRKGRGLRTW